MGEPCYSIVRKPKGFESANEMTLKRRIEGEDLEKCRMSIEELLQNVLDGEKFPPNLMMSVINRYQMNRFVGEHGGQDKGIKKLLYILWECLPKRGPDGKFLDKMVMVCGAFDKDLKHPNQYICGAVLRTLSKTREPEVIRELVHSIEKCLEWSHAYQRKNAVLAIARIYKNFPDLNPSAPKLISEYLLKENDDECKRAALQALLEIAPEEAQSYLHSCNIPDIHCMNASIQLLFVELIQRLYKKDSEESQTYLLILNSLIKSSSSPSVRYQAAAALTKFTRDPESIKIAAACFIDICAKDSDNNVKLIALDKLISLRKINSAERILRNSIMDILYILSSATDLELNEKILSLSLDLISPLNVGGVTIALKHEIKKMQDVNILSSQKDTVKYRRLLVDTVHKIADKFPNAIVENEMLDTLFDLLNCNSIGDKTLLRLIMLLRTFMTKNPSNRGSVLIKVQDCLNLVKDSGVTIRGLIELMGDFSETKEQLEKSYKVIKESLGELPIVESERRKAQLAMEGTGDGDKKSAANGDVDLVTKNMSRLVTADGSYAAQSAINFQTTTIEEQPTLRGLFLKNKFYTSTILCSALLKMACRYRKVSFLPEFYKMVYRFIYMLGSILHLGHSTLLDQEGEPIHMLKEHSEDLMNGIMILQKMAENDEDDIAKLTKKILTEDMRSQIDMFVKNLDQERSLFDSSKKSDRKPRFDDNISISLFAPRDDDSGLDLESDTEIESLMMPDMFAEVPLTGTLDPIYAYCEFDVNQYDIGIKIHLESRSKITIENLKLELSARGDGNSNTIDRPESIVLAPMSTACINTNVKVVSAENRRLFGCITFDLGDRKEQVMMLDDISINITDYIKPASISFEEFRDVWSHCEWENKVTVRTKLTNLREYLMQLVSALNMRCVTADRSLKGDCSFLLANLYARSSFGEEALVNVSIEKETPKSVVTGNVKIRSQSQGMALSLGEKITAVQAAASSSVAQK